MIRQPWLFDGKSWVDHLNPFFVRLMYPLRWWFLEKKYRLMVLEVSGIEHVKSLFDEGAGILITPNHSNDADANTMYAVADKLRLCFHFMTANHVFVRLHHVARWVLQLHGCFSVDLEGSDLRAFRRAVKILMDSHYPLVIFPEGAVYHLNDMVTPFRDGPAVIALSAAQKAKRPIYCIPCAIKYKYIDDPTPELEELMTELEIKINWRPQTDKPLIERIYKYAEAQVSLKEIEYLGSSKPGSIPERLTSLMEHILIDLETHYDLKAEGRTVPERVKELRRACLERLRDENITLKERTLLNIHIDDILVATQLFSYPGYYIQESPTIERIAETMDKFEEDVLKFTYAKIRGTKKVKVALGEPLLVSTFSHSSPRKDAPTLTDELEKRVQKLIDVLA